MRQWLEITKPVVSNGHSPHFCRTFAAEVILAAPLPQPKLHQFTLNFPLKNGTKNAGLSRYTATNRRFWLGAGGRARTPDLLITNQLLCQLSYTSISACFHSIPHPPRTCQDFLRHNFARCRIRRFLSKKFIVGSLCSRPKCAILCSSMHRKRTKGWIHL